MAGGGGLITFPLLMLVVGPMTADATSAVAGFASYPTAVWRTRNLLTGVLGSGWLAPRDPQFSRWIDWSAASESYGQSQLHRVRAVAGVTGHYYHCVAPGPGPTKRRRYLAARSRADVMAVRNGGHLHGGALWRIFWSGHRYPDDRRSDLHFAGRDSPCGCAEEFPELLDARSRCVCARA